jgi:NADPH:quinone reductase-like Zn-dependent oxidoreductase
MKTALIIAFVLTTTMVAQEIGHAPTREACVADLNLFPHSDGSGTVDAVGDGVSQEWVGRRVWCYGAQSYRPFGTAAEYTVLPLKLVVPLPKGVPLDQGACLGIPGITAHRAVHVGGSVNGKTVLVQGGAGAVGACAVQLAHQAGARVIATFRSEGDKEIASRAGADEVLLTGERGRDAGVTQNLPTMRTLENLCTVVSLSG